MLPDNWIRCSSRYRTLFGVIWSKVCPSLRFCERSNNAKSLKAAGYRSGMIRFAGTAIGIFET
jgi:hypothetical protein